MSDYSRFTTAELSMMAQRARVNNDLPKYYHIKGVINQRYAEMSGDIAKYYKDQERLRNQFA